MEHPFSACLLVQTTGLWRAEGILGDGEEMLWGGGRVGSVWTGVAGGERQRGPEEQSHIAGLIFLHDKGKMCPF